MERLSCDTDDLPLFRSGRFLLIGLRFMGVELLTEEHLFRAVEVYRPSDNATGADIAKELRVFHDSIIPRENRPFERLSPIHPTAGHIVPSGIMEKYENVSGAVVRVSRSRAELL